MANILAAKAGNWSDPTTWTGGILPGVNDSVDANSYTVVVDQDISVVTLKTAINGGTFSVDSISTTRTITCSATITGSYNTAITLTAPSGTLVINGNVTACSANGVSRVGLVVTGNANFVLNGNLGAAGTFANNGHAATFAGSGSKTINGNVTAQDGAGSGIYNTGAGSITVAGNVTAGASTVSYGIVTYVVGTTIFVAGNVTAYGSPGIYTTKAVTITVQGDAVGGNIFAGIYLDSAGSIVDVQGSAVASLTAPAITSVSGSNIYENTIRVRGPLVSASNNRFPLYTPKWMLYNTVNSEIRVRDDVNAPLGGEEVTLTNYIAASPAPSDVRAGYAYGPSGTLVGTLAMPAASAVAAGVPVDATVGTAAMTAAAVWAQEVSSGVSAGARLQATASAELVGAVLAEAVGH